MLRLLLIASLLGPLVNARASDRIIGGEDAFIETYPYQVSIEFYGGHGCGGSIISENWVITAGHCIDEDIEYTSVRAGTTYMDRGGSLHRVEKAIVHDDFDFRDDDAVPINDLALIRVHEPFVFDDTRQPIGLFDVDETYRGSNWSVVTGWGDTDKSYFDDQLQSVALPLVSREICRAAYEDLPEGQFCAGYYAEGGRDACQGDSGGPLVIDGRLAGIVSWGDGCAEAYRPGVYTEVGYYRNWIRLNSGI